MLLLKGKPIFIHIFDAKQQQHNHLVWVACVCHHIPYKPLCKNSPDIQSNGESSIYSFRCLEYVRILCLCV